jgi:hypothetical protein
VPQIADGLGDGGTHGWRLRDRVQHHEIVDRAVVPQRRDRSAGPGELAPVSLTAAPPGSIPARNRRCSMPSRLSSARVPSSVLERLRIFDSSGSKPQ